jgi:hypothetical protein
MSTEGDRRRLASLPDHLWAMRSPRLIVTGTLSLVMVAVAVWGFVVLQTISNTEKSCKAALTVRDAVVAVFVDAQERSANNPAQTATEQQRKDAAAFFDKSIATLRAADCPR